MEDTSTTREFLQQITQIENYKEKKNFKKMVDLDSYSHSDIDRYQILISFLPLKLFLAALFA